MKRQKFSKAKAYSILRQAVEDGIAWGWQRSHKHTDKPDEETIKDEMLNNIMNEICEKFDV